MYSLSTLQVMSTKLSLNYLNCPQPFLLTYIAPTIPPSPPLPRRSLLQ